MKRYPILLAVALAFGCNHKNTDETTEANQTASAEKNVKVYVSAKGEITANGEKITIEKLDQEFAELAKDSGVVYYSRANTADDGPVESMQVIELVMKNNLPLKFYEDSTFTKPVDPSGETQ